MAGHSKWSNIKYKKKRNDEKRSKIFSKLVGNIKSSLNDGVDLKCNYKFKSAVIKALDENISKTVIEKLTKNQFKSSVVQNIYSVILFKNIVFLIESCEKNNNKVIFELRCMVSKYSGSLVKFNDVIFLFNKVISFKIYSFYNEFDIYYLLCFLDVYSFNDNCLTVFIQYRQYVIDYFKMHEIKFLSDEIFVAKKNVDICSSLFDKLSKFKKSIKRRLNIKTIFTNVSDL